MSLGPQEAESWAGLVQRHVVTRSVRDSAAVLDVLEGYMTGDYYTAPPPARPYTQELSTAPGKLRIGMRTVASAGLAQVDPECVAATEDAAELLRSLGHTVEDASPTALDELVMLESFSAIMLTDVRATLMQLAETLGRPVTADDVEPLTWMNYEASLDIDNGTYVLAVKKAQAWTRRMAAWWLDDGFDILLTPTCAEPPPLLGDIGDQSQGGAQAAARSLPFAVFTAPFNVTGQPAMSMPLYHAASGLPIGVQLVGAPNREDVLIRLAAQLEEARPWSGRVPPVHA
jgi:amidase